MGQQDWGPWALKPGGSLDTPSQLQPSETKGPTCLGVTQSLRLLPAQGCAHRCQDKALGIVNLALPPQGLAWVCQSWARQGPTSQSPPGAYFLE